MNIPVAGYRQSGEMETVVPAFWKPLFRRFGNRYSGDLGTAAPQGHVPVAEQRSQSNHSLRLLSSPYTSRIDR